MTASFQPDGDLIDPGDGEPPVDLRQIEQLAASATGDVAKSAAARQLKVMAGEIRRLRRTVQSTKRGSRTLRASSRIRQRRAGDRGLAGGSEALRKGIAEDFRCYYADMQRVMEAAQAAGDPWRMERWNRDYAMGELPHDRRGLLAAIHPALDPLDEKHDRAMWEWTSGRAGQPMPNPDVDEADYYVPSMAEELAKRLGRRVYHVQTDRRWNLILLALDNGEYDENDHGKYASDQYIAYYEPDGSFHFVGCS